jgi:asparagine synthase (glutamine-hydrolysing)
MLRSALLPGFLASTGGTPDPRPPGAEPATVTSCGPVTLRHWGLRPVPGSSAPDVTLVVSRVARGTDGRVSEGEIAHALRERPGALAGLLPPFAALAGDAGGIRVATDFMGFEHVFATDPEGGRGPSVSTSALVAGETIRAPLDHHAVAVQSLLGWQLAQRTLFEGVRKLPPGATVELGDGGLRVEQPPRPVLEPISLREAVTQAAALLRTSLAAVLDDHPDAVLQLTGGMDSRLLLSAIPAARRRGLHAMTLDVPGKGDVAVARAIAERYGIDHDVRGLADIGDVSPEESWDLCRAAATRLDGMSDPVALAAQLIAERAFAQGVRISGLGGEIARGFYYTGRVADRSYSKKDAARLAAWRMFVNEAVEPGLLDAGFSSWAHSVATDEVFAALSAGGGEWFRATDELYLRHRMQRWAGATDTAVSAERVVINPMLDHGFLEIAGRLTPRDKAESRFLGALQMELDGELGRMPLDGRPAPATYADPPRWQPVVRAMSTARRAARKGLQKARRGNRPPAGGTVLAGKVVEHWRANPGLVARAAALPFVDDGWVQRMLDVSIEPRPSSVAFLTNLVVALGADETAQGPGETSSS